MVNKRTGRTRGHNSPGGDSDCFFHFIIIVDNFSHHVGLVVVLFGKMTLFVIHYRSD